VRAIGRGPTVVVVHGGPGFDHRYLMPAFSDLAERRRLVFYDQFGCGRSDGGERAFEPETLYEQFRAVCEDCAPVGVLAHSWGAFIALASGATFDEGVFVTPMPLDAAGFGACQERLLQRIPTETFARFEALAAAGDAEAIVRLMLPFYLAPQSTADVHDLSFDPVAFNRVVANLGAFDITARASAAANIDVALGAADFIAADHIGRLAATARRVEVMDGTGHFPFYEDPEGFAAILARAFPARS